MKTLRLFLRLVLCLLLFCLTAIAFQISESPNISGRWEVEGVVAGPWVFDLTASGNVVTGRIFQHGSLSGPTEIFDGKFEGTTLTIKTTHPVVTNATKELTFTGRVLENQIVFDRTVEILVNSPGPADTGNMEMGVYGAQAIPRFVAKRTGPVPVAPTPIRSATAPVDVTGRWESLQWNQDIWLMDLRSTGNQLSGTVGVMAAPGREAVSNSRPIYDAKIENNTISFKAKSVDNVRTISFTGKAQGDEILVYRSVQLAPGGAVGFNVPLGVYAPMSFVARRITNAGPSALPKEFTDARQKWTARSFKNYEFAAQWICICDLPPQPFTYRVTGDVGVAQLNPSVLRFIGVPPAGVQPIVERYGTIDKIFSWLEKESTSRPYSLKVEYDPAVGYPRSVDLVPVGIAIDGNIQLRISDFKVLN